MKKWLAVMLTVLILLSAGTFTVTAGLENKAYGDYTYTVIGETASIVNVKTDISGNVVIPSSIEGYPVTGIGDRAFSGCDRMTSVKIPSKVTAIGEGAFGGCAGLTDFTVAFGNKAFCARDGVLFNKDRTVLVCYPAGKTETAYTVFDGVTTIGAAAFAGAAKLERVTVADNVESLGNKAFEQCSGLKQIVFGVGLKTIGDEAFAGCESLPSVTVPNSATSLGRAAFSGCRSLENVTLGRGLTGIGATTFLGCESLKQVSLPDNVTSILSSAFSGCTGLEKITIPDGVTTVGAYAFYECENLKTVLYTGDQAKKDALVIGAKNEALGTAEWQYDAPSFEPPAEDTSVGPQPVSGPDSNVVWAWVMIGGIAVLLTVAVIVVIVFLVRGIKKIK